MTDRAAPRDEALLAEARLYEHWADRMGCLNLIRRLIVLADSQAARLRELEEALRPMIEAYRLWATGRMSASDFGDIADRAVIAFDKLGRAAAALREAQ